jgi:hypothetical protein
MLAKINSSDVEVAITYDMKLDESGLITTIVEDNSNITISTKLYSFLKLCLGNYKISDSRLTICFEDNRDYVNYCLQFY